MVQDLLVHLVHCVEIDKNEMLEPRTVVASPLEKAEQSEHSINTTINYPFVLPMIFHPHSQELINIYI